MPRLVGRRRAGNVGPGGAEALLSHLPRGHGDDSAPGGPATAPARPARSRDTGEAGKDAPRPLGRAVFAQSLRNAWEPPEQRRELVELLSREVLLEVRPNVGDVGSPRPFELLPAGFGEDGIGDAPVALAGRTFDEAALLEPLQQPRHP